MAATKKQPLPIPERLDQYTRIAESGCWDWIGFKDPKGYGRLTIPVGDGRYIPRLAHRLSYERHKGKIPEGLHIDHLCRNTSCINPEHLEPVTLQENARRGDTYKWRKRHTHCTNGHEFTPENTRLYRGTRYCRECWKTVYKNKFPSQHK